MSTNEIIIATRSSQLAIIQTNLAVSWLKKLHPQYSYTIMPITTTGDKNLEKKLSEIGTKGAFIKELESALLNNKADIAVHSLKDMPALVTEGLSIGAVLPREDNRDVLVAQKPLNMLQSGAKIGTSSLRRKVQILALRDDLNVADIRGNLNTRISKVLNGDYDGIILAMAGLKRIDQTGLIAEVFDQEAVIPAVGQGAIAIECRNNDFKVLELLENVNHEQTWLETTAERSFLREIEGGCHISVGAYATIADNIINLTGFISDLSGKTVINDSVQSSNAEKAGFKLAKSLIDKGADKILSELNH